ncbi:flavoprotein [Moorella sulfitireducens]|uniref:flavoprotein n=1 Tax=Neomoorella sulfitireducens TaxID=2972948 RepID=UPI0021AC8D5D|nr:flavoprotein [Moorella sulfitireducens]
MTGEKRVTSRIAWGITGGGHFLAPCMELLVKLHDIDVFISRAAREVLAGYGLLESLLGCGHRLYWDRSASSRAVTGLYRGYYRLVIIAPATSNTIAKFVAGISDNLVTNLFAHAGKCRVPVVVLPTDIGPEIDSPAPPGFRVRVYPRNIDLENVARLSTCPGVTVVKHPREIDQILSTSRK